MRFSDEKSRRHAISQTNCGTRPAFMMNLDIDEITLSEKEKLALEDKWILTRFNAAAASVNTNLDKFEIGVALSTLYDFIWDEYCDWYIELSKASVTSEDKRTQPHGTVRAGMEFWEPLSCCIPSCPSSRRNLQRPARHRRQHYDTDLPTASDSLQFTEEAAAMEKVIAAIKAIRAREEMNVPPSRKARSISSPEIGSFWRSTPSLFMRLASASKSYGDRRLYRKKVPCRSSLTRPPSISPWRIWWISPRNARLQRRLSTVENEIKRAKTSFPMKALLPCAGPLFRRSVTSWQDIKPKKPA